MFSMRKSVVVLGVLTGFMFADSNVKPSFDCAKADSVVEHLVCADSELARLDSKMAKLYSTARAKASSEERAALLKEQRAWIKKYRQCKSRTCILESLYSRIGYLQDYVDNLSSVRDSKSQDSKEWGSGRVDSKESNIIHRSKPKPKVGNDEIEIQYESQKPIQYSKDKEALIKRLNESPDEDNEDYED